MGSVSMNQAPKSLCNTAGQGDLGFGNAGTGVLPFSVLFQNNQLINRSYIELLGYAPPTIALARNRYERYEKALDEACWLLLAVVGPVIIERVLSQRVTTSFRQDPKLAKYFTDLPKYTPENGLFRRLHQAISHMGKNSPLRVQWQWLQQQAMPITDTEINRQRVKDLGVKSLSALQEMVKDSYARKRLIRSKMAVVVLDLVLMATSNFISQWGKNALTERLSHQSGFSGTLNYASKAYQSEKNKTYQQEKDKRWKQSLGVAVGVITGISSFILGGISVKGTGKLKQAWRNSVSSLFNYSNGIFMSKWLTLFGGFGTWLILGMLAARDQNELREHVIKTGVLAATYTVGDDLLSGLGAKFLQGKKVVKQAGVNVVKDGLFGLPDSVKLQELLVELKAKGMDETHKVYKLAKANFWFGLAGAALMTGAAVPLLNNWYTKKKVLAEQAVMMKRYLPLFQRPLRVDLTSAMQPEALHAVTN